MVDFAKKTLELRAWRIRKNENLCACQSQNPKVCFGLTEDVYGDEDSACKCICHKEPAC